MTVREILSCQRRGLKFVTIGDVVLNRSQQDQLIAAATHRGVQDSAAAVTKLAKTIR